jgi:hypothetical protein
MWRSWRWRSGSWRSRAARSPTTADTGDLNPDPNQTAMVYGETAGNPRGGNAWDGSGTQGPHDRDGCTQPDIDFGR